VVLLRAITIYSMMLFMQALQRAQSLVMPLQPALRSLAELLQANTFQRRQSTTFLEACSCSSRQQRSWEYTDSGNLVKSHSCYSSQ
jgi:hypothetical protein